MLSGSIDRKAKTILAIETSTRLLGVAVVDDTGIRCELIMVQPRIHSKMLLPLCMQALDMVGLTPENVDCLAVSNGPGSFTGLRIGCATVQGLGFAANKPVVQVPTVEVYLRQCSAYPAVGIVQGKSKSQTVCALYKKASGLRHTSGFWNLYGFEEIVPIGAKTYTEFCNDLSKTSIGPVWVTGDAAIEFCEVAREAGLHEVSVAGDHIRLPRPGVVGLIGMRMFKRGKVVSPSSVVPEYYRRSQAEVVFAKKQTKGDVR